MRLFGCGCFPSREPIDPYRWSCLDHVNPYTAWWVEYVLPCITSWAIRSKHIFYWPLIDRIRISSAENNRLAIWNWIMETDVWWNLCYQRHISNRNSVTEERIKCRNWRLDRTIGSQYVQIIPDHLWEISLFCNYTFWFPSCFLFIYDCATEEWAEILKSAAQIR